jgi:hypothetical protein
MIVANRNTWAKMVFFDPLENEGRTGFCIDVVYYPHWRPRDVVESGEEVRVELG